MVDVAVVGTDELRVKVKVKVTAMSNT